jgi:hypothetical protein
MPFLFVIYFEEAAEGAEKTNFQRRDAEYAEIRGERSFHKTRISILCVPRRPRRLRVELLVPPLCFLLFTMQSVLAAMNMFFD